MAVSVEPVVAHRRVETRWFLIGAIGLLLLIVIAYFGGGAAMASSSSSKADGALNAVLRDKTEIAAVFDNDPFKTIVFNADNPNISADQQALANMKTKLDHWQAQIATGRSSLQDAQAHVSSSVLTLPERSRLDRYRQRIAAALAALDSAQATVKIQQRQVAFLNPFLDVISGIIGIGNAGQAHDANAMLNALNKTEASMQSTLAAAQGADVPPQITYAVNVLQKAVQDFKSLVASVVSGDSAGIDYNVEQLTIDGRTLSAIKQDKVEEAQRLQFAPLRDSYVSQMKLAARA